MKRAYTIAGLSFSILLAGLFIATTEVAIAAPDKDKEHGHGHHEIALCPTKEDDGVRCHAHVDSDAGGKPAVTSLPSGYGPAQFLGAYGLTGFASSSNPIIAIVDAYDDPYIQSDLNKYSQTFGIPSLPACAGSIGASAIPCFKKVNQTGGTVYPKANAGWALEISLDVETAHAICQNCKILLVEARSASYADLMTAVDQAVAMGATVVSNSYGSNEFAGETAYDTHFNRPGVIFTFSAGDSGYGAEYPAASPYVTAVGGTSLILGPGNTYGSESVWSGSGSGCSLYEGKPVWQTDLLCTKRTVADVSADADPATGAAVYDSMTYQGQRGWFKVGGTSLSAPLIAATYMLAGNVSTSATPARIPYDNFSLSSFNDVSSGSNGSCGATYLCTGMSGYDGPTGLGSPKGFLAF